MLFVVATPIGNLDDLSPRARQVLADVDLIAAEDTRRTGRLLSHFGIETPQIALHEHNEDEVVAQLLGRLGARGSVALVSDAGTPLISDPGYRLLRAAHSAGVRVSPIPGASAAVAALSVAGLPTDRFCFEGFLPPRRPARRATLEALRREPRTLVFFESVHRIADLLADLAETFGDDRRAFIGRELSKMHEQCVAASLGELRAMLGDGRIAARGEFVVVVDGAEPIASDSEIVDIDQLIKELRAVLPGKQAVAVAASITGRARNELYRRMLELED